MNDIGKKIKQLRKHADLTQEQLAELLGVSYQAISKWETGTTSPDLSMIAPITRLFKITADELFGLSESADDARQRELRERWAKTYDSGDIEERYQIARQAVAEYPGNYEYLDWLADAEASCAIHNCPRGSEEQRVHYERAVKYYEVIVENCQDETWKNDALYGLATTLPDLGRREEAIRYARMHPKSDELLKWCLVGEDLEKHWQNLIRKEMRTLVFDLEFGHRTLDAIRAAEAILKNLIPDGNYLFEHDTLMHNYIWQAECLAKENRGDEAIACLKLSYEHARQFEESYVRAKKSPLPYTCKIFDRLSFDANEVDWSGTNSLTEDFVEYLARRVFDGIRSNPEFVKLTELKTTRGRP